MTQEQYTRDKVKYIGRHLSHELGEHMWERLEYCDEQEDWRSIVGLVRQYTFASDNAI